MDRKLLEIYSGPDGEFELSDEGVFHLPSGAMFWALPECDEPHDVDWGKAKDVNEDGAPLFDEDWIKDTARALLKLRLANEEAPL
ncbi:MAG: hypothetical protein WCF79_08770 [Rhodomicrobium sp.]